MITKYLNDLHDFRNAISDIFKDINLKRKEIINLLFELSEIKDKINTQAGQWYDYDNASSEALNYFQTKEFRNYYKSIVENKKQRQILSNELSVLKKTIKDYNRKVSKHDFL